LLVTTYSNSKAQELANILHCKASTFPITYLGLPLSDRKLTRSAYLPLIQQEERRLPGWRAHLLSIGRRLTLLNSVLIAQHVYYMSAFFLPKWVIRKIDQIRRRFLWHGYKQHQENKHPLCMVSWALVVRSKEIGGLSIRDLEQMNISLLMKWMWQWVSLDNIWWKETIITSSPHIRPWEMAQASPFWKNMTALALICNASVIYQVKQGTMVQF
jgi:hypothetical protein